ncbi:MAG: 3-methyl-2-oxobutanoate hydroxymethyltransferase [Candidatus Neomarinimicrobiota bacterium]
MKTTITHFQESQRKGEPIVMVTAYDYTMAYLAEAAGIRALLVGDSLGMVVQGNDTTIPVTLEETIYHTKLVVRGAPESFVIADMPFMSFQISVEDALRSCGRVLKETGAHGVKLEGGEEIVPQVKALVAIGIPTMGHIGLQPQSVHLYGGFGKRGKTPEEHDRLLQYARQLEAAGAFAMVVENVSHALAEEITAAVQVPTIGIGAGPACDGQIQVFHDLLGLKPDFLPRHSKRYAEIGEAIITALSNYAADVQQGKFLSR